MVIFTDGITSSQGEKYSDVNCWSVGTFHLRCLTGIFTLPQSPARDTFSINGNTGKAGDTGFVG